MAVKPVLLISPSGNDADAQELAKFGLAYEALPLQTIKYLDEFPGLIDGLNLPGAWLIITSKNALKGLMRHAPNPLPSQLNFLAIGPGSAAAVSEFTAQEIITATRPSSESVLTYLLSRPPGIALLPVGNLNSNILIDGLRENGWRVICEPTYLNQELAQCPAKLESNGISNYSVVLVRSPSAARALAKFCQPREVSVVSTGGVTAGEVEKLGFKLSAVSRDNSAAALAQAVAGLFQEERK